MINNVIKQIVLWFDGAERKSDTRESSRYSVEWIRVLPFIAVHLACFAVIWVGWSPIAVAVAAVMYFVRMFAITAFYHRYFSHRTFKTSRLAQFVFGVIGSSATQKGPLWWSAHHRHHHRHSDDEHDVHSVRQHGFWWSHVGWIVSPRHVATDYNAVSDLYKFPELRWLDRFDMAIPFLTAVAMFGLGMLLGQCWPTLGTSGWQMLVWGFFISTVVLYHGTFCINSLCHVIGTKRYKTKDDSRNSLILALVTLGEGWHNNHHRYPGSVRQGFFWWEIDITYYGLVVLSWLRIIWDLNPVPNRLKQPEATAFSPT